MEDDANLLESLLDKAAEYGKTSFELVKLKTLDKTTELVSSIIPHTIVILLVITFLLFMNVGIALWLGEMLGKVFYGFFVVAAFYLLIGIIIHFILNKWIKRLIGDYFIKRILK